MTLILADSYRVVDGLKCLSEAVNDFSEFVARHVDEAFLVLLHILYCLGRM